MNPDLHTFNAKITQVQQPNQFQNCIETQMDYFVPVL